MRTDIRTDRERLSRNRSGLLRTVRTGPKSLAAKMALLPAAYGLVLLLIWRATRDRNNVVSEHFDLFTIVVGAWVLCAQHGLLILLGALTRRFNALVRLLDEDGALDREVDSASSASPVCPGP